MVAGPALTTHSTDNPTLLTTVSAKAPPRQLQLAHPLPPTPSNTTPETGGVAEGDTDRRTGLTTPTMTSPLPLPDKYSSVYPALTSYSTHQSETW
jgi:hypothetical protein